MNLETRRRVVAAAYAGISESATLTSVEHGASTVSLVRESSNATQLAASLLGLRGIVTSFRAMKSEIANRPVSGDTIETADGTHTVDQAEDIDETEWRIYVRS